MPRRSNAFQRVILLIHQHLAGTANVDESVLLPDRDTGTLREVDVVLESVVSDYRVLVSIECCDRNRRATVEWVEQMCRKHASLPTSKLVLVSRSGFAESALRKAQAHGAEALTIEQAAAVPWTAVVDKVTTVFIRATEAITAVYPCQDPSPGDTGHRALPYEAILCSPDGEWRFPIRQFVDAILASPRLRPRLVDSLSSNSDGGFLVNVPVAQGTQVLGVEGGTLEPQVLTLVLLTKRRTTPVPLTPGVFRGYRIACGEGTSDLGFMLVTIVEREGERPQGLLLRRKGRLRETLSLRRECATLDPAPDEAMRAILNAVPSAI